MQILHNVLFVDSDAVYGDGGFVPKTIMETNTASDNTLTVYDYIKLQHTNSVVLRTAYSRRRVL